MPPLRDEREEPLRLAVIDDNEDDRVLIVRQLERELPRSAIRTIINTVELEQLLDDGQFDVVITDYQLRWSDGLRVLRAVKTRYPERPVIMFTNTGTEEVAVEAMKIGLDDYIIKTRHSYGHVPVAVLAAFERVAAKRRAAELEQRLQTLLDRLNVGVYEAVPDGPITAANSALLTLLGVSSVEELAKLDLAPLRTTPAPAERAESREVQLRRVDGRTIWASVSQVVRADGEHLRSDGLVEDITERKQARERAEQLAEEARAAVHVRDAFLAVASHELKTPLTALLGHTELALRRIEQSPTAEPRLERSIRVIASQAQRLTRLVNSILDLSRLQNNRLRLALAPVDLCALVDRVVAEMQFGLEPARLTLHTSDGPLLIDGDESRLEQVVVSLVQNALKYSDAHTAVVVRLTREGSEAHLAVEDHGIGIPAAALPELFGRFYRAPNVDVDHISGMGMSLFLAREIIGLHCGTIDVESEEGRGSTFTVRLPLTRP